MKLEEIQQALAKLPAEILPLSSGLDHLGVAVKSIEQSLLLYHELLGLPLLYVEEVKRDKVKVAVLEFGSAHLELLEGTSSDSPVSKFIERRGEGLHHLALRVKDCQLALTELKKLGIQLIDETPRPGAGGKSIGFIHPKATGGVLLELCTHAD